MSATKQHKLGLVLSGGGVKGAAHIGVLKALEEYTIKPTIVSGTSAGSLAGAFYACGYSADEVLQLMTQSNFFKFNALSFTQPGMLNAEKLLEVFKPYFEGKTFESLDVELQVAATDIIHGTLKIFNSGELFKPLLASCAFPFIFSPIAIGNSLYSDGGIINNFPTDGIANKADKVLGIYVSPLRKITKENLISAIDVADRAYRIANRYESINKLSQCTWVINPHELEQYGTFTLSKIKEIYEIGYRYGLEIAPIIKEELEENS